MTIPEVHERLGADPEVTSENFLSYSQEISRIAWVLLTMSCPPYQAALRVALF